MSNQNCPNYCIGVGFVNGHSFLAWPRLTSGFSRIATVQFFNCTLLAKLVYNVTGLAQPQSAEPQALGGQKGCFIEKWQASDKRHCY